MCHCFCRRTPAALAEAKSTKNHRECAPTDEWMEPEKKDKSEKHTTAPEHKIRLDSRRIIQIIHWNKPEGRTAHVWGGFDLASLEQLLILLAGWESMHVNILIAFCQTSADIC